MSNIIDRLDNYMHGDDDGGEEFWMLVRECSREITGLQQSYGQLLAENVRLRAEVARLEADAARLKVERDAANELMFDGWRVLDAFARAYRAAIDAARAGGAK